MSKNIERPHGSSRKQDVEGNSLMTSKDFRRAWDNLLRGAGLPPSPEPPPLFESFEVTREAGGGGNDANTRLRVGRG